MTVPQPSRGQDDPQPFTHRGVPNAGLHRDLLLTFAHRWQAVAAAASERAAEARKRAGSAVVCEELLATAGTAVRELRQRLAAATGDRRPATGARDREREREREAFAATAACCVSRYLRWRSPTQQCRVRIEEELTLDTLLADLSE